MINSRKELDKIVKNLSKTEYESFIENRFPYIFTKSYYFIEDGYKLYREKDAFNFPDKAFTSNDLELVSIGCKQIQKGLGFRIEFPLYSLGVRGMYKLFELFHFEPINQKLINSKKGNFIDKITFRHLVDKQTVTYFHSL